MSYCAVVPLFSRINCYYTNFCLLSMAKRGPFLKVVTLKDSSSGGSSILILSLVDIWTGQRCSSDPCSKRCAQCGSNCPVLPSALLRNGLCDVTAPPRLRSLQRIQSPDPTSSIGITSPRTVAWAPPVSKQLAIS